jgi:hypothetical protein
MLKASIAQHAVGGKLDKKLTKTVQLHKKSLLLEEKAWWLGSFERNKKKNRPFFFFVFFSLYGTIFLSCVRRVPPCQTAGLSSFRM